MATNFLEIRKTDMVVITSFDAFVENWHTHPKEICQLLISLFTFTQDILENCYPMNAVESTEHDVTTKTDFLMYVISLVLYVFQIIYNLYQMQ